MTFSHHFVCRVFAVATIAWGLSGTMPGLARGESVWSLGHGDIGVAYDPALPNVFEMEVHAEDGAVIDGVAITVPGGQAFEPGDIVIRVPSAANLQRINNPTAFWTGLPNNGYNFTTSNYDALGVPVGGNLWVLSANGADADHYSTPFVGWATEEGFTGEDFGPVTFSVTSFVSPTGGNMAVYEGPTPQWMLLHGDTNFTGDAFAVAAGGHVHRTLFFTSPGLYQVGIRATATHPTVGPVQGDAIYAFSVVPEPSLLALGACAAAAGIPLARLRRRRLNLKQA